MTFDDGVAVQEVAAPGTVSAAAPLFFPVSPLKLVVMTTCTFGLYGLFWFYENWWLVRLRERSRLVPVLRAMFAYLFCYSLFRRVRNASTEHGLQAMAAGPLAAGWIFFALLGVLPPPYGLGSYLAVFFLVRVQVEVNRINAVAVPDHDRNARFSAGNIATVVIGGLLFLATLALLILNPRRI